MKIAMIGQKGFPAKFGGVETHVENLSKNLTETGHDISVYARKWYIAEKLPKTDINIVRTPTLNTKHLDTIIHTFTSTVHALFKDYDIIHYHAVGPSLLSWIPRLFSNKKVVCTFHCIDRKHEKWGWFAKKILTLGEWAACKFPHKTIAVSKGIKKYIKKHYNCNAKYIPNGVPLYKKEKNDDLIKKWGLKKNNYIFVLSRLIPHKGIHYAIQAYKELKKANKINKKLAIVGDGHHTSKYVKRLKKLSDNDKDIIFTGFQSGKTLEQLFSNAYLMLSPSDAEGLPITMLEGMSYNLPVLASNIEEHKELVTNTNYLFEQGNIDNLEAKLDKILNTKTKKLQKEGLNNRKKIEQNYTWKKVTKETEKMYKNILQENYIFSNKTISS